MTQTWVRTSPLFFVSGLLLLTNCSGIDPGPVGPGPSGNTAGANATVGGNGGGTPSAGGAAGTTSVPAGGNGTSGGALTAGAGGAAAMAGAGGNGSSGAPGGGQPGGGSAGSGGSGDVAAPIVIDAGRMNRQDINFTPTQADPAAQSFHGQQRGTFDGSKKVQGKLVVTMGGIGGGAHTGGVFQYAAGRGFHMLGVDMYNSEGGESNQGKVYLESFSGQDLTPVANVTPPNGVMSRIKKGLAYLQSQDPGAAWGYYLDAQGEVRWQDVILFGYSYGGQTALAATKYVAPYRTIITAAPTLPNDASWLTEMQNVADVNKCFAINSAGEAAKFDKLTMAGWPGTPQNVMNDAYQMVMQPPFMNTSKIQAPGGHTEFCSVAGDRYDVICDFVFDVKK
jgi:dienelactone hydrolase